MAKLRHVTDPAACGRRIAELRAERGLSQRELAVAGCTYAFISRIEVGARTPGWGALEHIAEKLGTTPEYLATGIKPPMQRGLEEAGLELHQLTEHERAVLEQALELEIEHTAKIVGEAIVDQRIEAGTAATS